ncbi:MAG TPA: zinc ribbon domain-containing protein [Syntrophomonadaceae bacterium]|nr:zinc ribbon domain-containing protein [Syntrophomonadaceae bacterium]
MPTYDYKCEHCGRFQVTQRITEPALEECPTCGQPVERLISRNVAIIFKGPGFYCTDNRSESLDEKKKPAAPKTEKEQAKAPST